MELRQKLMLLKSQNGLTTDALSERSGVPKGTINKLLNGATRNPTAGTLRRLAEAAPLTAERLAAACFVSLDAARARLASAPRRVNQTVMAQVEALYAQPVQELPPVGRGGICRSWAG